MDRQKTPPLTGHTIRLPVMQGGAGRDYFEKARLGSASLLFAAGLTAAAGSLLEWAHVVECPPRRTAEVAARCASYNGITAGDGWVSLVAGAGVILCAVLLAIRGRGVWARLAFLASIVVGAVGMSAYRAVSDTTSAISLRTGAIGRYEAAIGVSLVAAAGLIGLIASVGGIAATPRGPEA